MILSVGWENHQNDFPSNGWDQKIVVPHKHCRMKNFHSISGFIEFQVTGDIVIFDNKILFPGESIKWLYGNFQQT